MTDLYNDIRPYRDHEVSSVVDTLLSDNEFIDTLIALRGNRIAKWMPGLVRLFARRTMKAQLAIKRSGSLPFPLRLHSPCWLD